MYHCYYLLDFEFSVNEEIQEVKQKFCVMITTQFTLPLQLSLTQSFISLQSLSFDRNILEICFLK